MIGIGGFWRCLGGFGRIFPQSSHGMVGCFMNDKKHYPPVLQPMTYFLFPFLFLPKAAIIDKTGKLFELGERVSSLVSTNQ